MNTETNFGDAIQIDMAIYQLAAYDFANGLLMVPETADQFIEMQKGIAKKFNYFKKSIQNNEITFEEIQRSVINKNGPFPIKKMTSDEIVDKVMEDSKINEDIQPSSINVLQKLFEDILKMSGQGNYTKTLTLNEDKDGFSSYILPKTDYSSKTETKINNLPNVKDKSLKGKKGKDVRKPKSVKNNKSKKDI